MSDLRPDGTVVQTGFSHGFSREDPLKNMPFVVRGTVFGVHYPDDPGDPQQPGSESKAYMEYDVALWSPRQVLYHVPMLTMRDGVNDGDVVVLRAATIPLQDTDYTTDTQGDIVLVLFENGDFRKPLIIGAYPHPKGTIIKTRADGEVRRIKHKGTTIDIASNGAVSITSADEVTVTSSGGATAVLHADGSVNVMAASGKNILETAQDWATQSSTVHLVDPSATQPLVLGTTRNTDLTVFLTALETAFSALAAAFTPATGLLASAWTAPADEGVASSAMDVAVLACAAQIAKLPTEISTKAFTE
jgi:hypothetical protein